MPTFTPPPTVRESDVEAYAACQHPLCQSGEQRVAAHKTVVEHTFLSRGGDIPGVENSHVYLTFADEGEQKCVACGSPRSLSEQPRPEYQPLSGHDPMGLVNGSVARFDPMKQHVVGDERTAELEAKLAQTQAQLDALMAALVPVEDDEPAKKGK